jgi:hypothetical protein
MISTLGRCCHLIFNKFQTLGYAFDQELFDFCVEIITKTDELTAQETKKEYLVDYLINFLSKK